MCQNFSLEAGNISFLCSRQTKTTTIITIITTTTTTTTSSFAGYTGLSDKGPDERRKILGLQGGQIQSGVHQNSIVINISFGQNKVKIAKKHAEENLGFKSEAKHH